MNVFKLIQYMRRNQANAIYVHEYTNEPGRLLNNNNNHNNKNDSNNNNNK